MIRVLLVGAGQIGSRHLQALARLDRPASITVVEPSPDAQRTARARFDEVPAPARPPLEVVAAMPQGDFDVAIVATGADVRRPVVEALLAHAGVGALLLEKVLFQRLEDYDAVGELLERRQVPAWVNCAQRMWPLFAEAKRRYPGSGPVELLVEGARWGLGCNAIHNLDFLPYLTGQAAMQLESRLDPGTVPAKRTGYVEFTGTLVARDLAGNRVVQTSSRAGDTPFSMRVRTRDAETMLDAGAVPRQSELTHLVVQSLVDAQCCELPRYAESAAVHRAMLKVFLSHLGSGEGARDVCPIT